MDVPIKNTVLKLLPIITLWLVVSVKCEDLAGPVVSTKQGLIEGTLDGISRDGRQFYQFRGIQYALIGERFTAAVETQSWEGTKPAKKYGTSCDAVYKHGNENCLFLNVFTSSLANDKLANDTTLKPVVVALDGWFFQFGSGDKYGPNYMIDEDVVFVTINSRVGVLGYLSTGDPASPGNYGLKDQVMALKWIQDNIHAFGGNKERVTLMGQNSGSASVTYHLVSPMSKGLFHRAIAQSGTFLDPWAFTRKPLRYATKLAKYFNCSDTTNTTAIVNCLRTIPSAVIAQHAVVRNVTLKFFAEPMAAFGPTIEPLIGDGSTTFLASSPYQLLASGEVSSRVPLLSGVTKEEGIYVWASYMMFSEVPFAVQDRQNLSANFSRIAPFAFYFDEHTPANGLQETAQSIEQFYFGSKGFTLDSMYIDCTFKILSQLYSDRMFVSSAVRFMNLYAKLAPTFPYLYTFNKFVGMEFENGGWNSFKQNRTIEATHAAELDMIISPLSGKVRTDPVHDQVSKSVTKLWASFIKEGVPIATYGSERQFPAINPEEGLQKWYKLDIDTELSDNLFSKRTAFWDSLRLSDNDFDNCFNC